jgi:hypothetical protein
LSFYAWKINRDWQKSNQPYLRKLAAASQPKGAGKGGSPPLAKDGWIDATHRPVIATPAGS